MNRFTSKLLWFYMFSIIATAFVCLAYLAVDIKKKQEEPKTPQRSLSLNDSEGLKKCKE